MVLEFFFSILDLTQSTWTYSDWVSGDADVVICAATNISVTKVTGNLIVNLTTNGLCKFPSGLTSILQ